MGYPVIPDSGKVSANRLRRTDPYDHVWHWRANELRTVDRKGQRCRVIARGAKNSILVEFADGLRVVASRYAVRKVVPHVA